MKNIKQVNYEELSFHERLQFEMSTYSQKIINDNGTVTQNVVDDPYFLMNDTWSIDYVGRITNFNKQYSSYNQSTKNINFKMKSLTVNLEIKYVWYQKLFKEEWTLTTVFGGQNPTLNRISEFLNFKYHNLDSLLNLDSEKLEREWLFWLSEKGLKTKRTKKNGSEVQNLKTSIATSLPSIYTKLFQLTDYREEWEKERWDVRNLHSKYGIEYNLSVASYYIDFTKIQHSIFQEQVKRYIKQRLLSKNNFTWASAQLLMQYLPRFLGFIYLIQPNWKDLNALKRNHIEQYIQSLHEYTKSNLKNKNANPERYIARSLSYLQIFLEDIQRYQYDIAPITNVRLLVFTKDKPKQKKKSIDHIDYIPDHVLEQLFANINDLHKDVQPVLWVAFKTGLRISDTLGLTQDCLIKLNGKYYIETDIEKTYVKGHRIPIDEDLANILAVFIHESKVKSNDDNNPNKFIFVCYRGSRKGKPIGQERIRSELNVYAKAKNITDEDGNLFHFKTHQFRHTYAVKMLNGGADILTVQELLAHASPVMTMRYAKLIDETKRKAFEEVMKQGVFSFDINGEVQEVQPNEDTPTDILEMLWQDHKLNAIDNPYGTCHARINGNCPYAEEPPCLTCNGGSPCKDLGIGFSDFDKHKYELLIKTTSRTIEALEQRGRNEVAEKNKKNLARYQNILKTIEGGHIIFGRLERAKRKQGALNG
jgi:integrase